MAQQGQIGYLVDVMVPFKAPQGEILAFFAGNMTEANIVYAQSARDITAIYKRRI